MRDGRCTLRIDALHVSLPAGVGAAEARAWARELACALASRLNALPAADAVLPSLHVEAPAHGAAHVVARRIADRIERQLRGGGR